jgi:hypothetical protein
MVGEAGASSAVIGGAVAQPSSSASEESTHGDEAFPFTIAVRAYLGAGFRVVNEIEHSLSRILQMRRAGGNMCAMPTKAKKVTKKKTATKAKKAPAKKVVKKVVAKKAVKKAGAKKAAPKAALKSARVPAMRGCCGGC